MEGSTTASASACCSCGCKVCGADNEAVATTARKAAAEIVEVFVYVCTSVGCNFEHRDRQKVEEHKIEEHPGPPEWEGRKRIRRKGNKVRSNAGGDEPSAENDSVKVEIDALANFTATMETGEEEEEWDDYYQGEEEGDEDFYPSAHLVGHGEVDEEDDYWSQDEGDEGYYVPRRGVKNEPGEANENDVEEKKRGRPRGSKKILRGDDEDDWSDFLPVKRKRGRPRGSKTRSRGEREALNSVHLTNKKKVGRPKGSKNKAKLKMLEKDAFSVIEEWLKCMDDEDEDEGEGSSGGHRPYKCESCDFASSSESRLASHSRGHGVRVACDCPGCDFVSDHPRSLRLHENLTHFTDSRFDCGRDRGSLELLERSNLVKSEGEGDDDFNPWRCSKCGERFRRRLRAELHVVRKHLDESKRNVIPCETCNFTTGHTELLKWHIKISHWREMQNDEPEEERTCPICGVVCPSKRELRYHKQLEHDSSETILCHLCGYSTKHGPSMKVHKARLHGSYICDKCDFQTTKESELNRHMRYVHRQFCDTCELPLCRGETTATHECPTRLGPGPPPPEYIATLEERSRNINNTRIKRLPPEEGGRFLCIVCGLRGRLLITMSRHVHLLHSEHRCHLCDFQTVHQPTLIKHVKNRHPLLCPDCGHRCGNKRELSKHTCLPQGVKANEGVILENEEQEQKKEQLKVQNVTCPECGFVPSIAASLHTHMRNMHWKDRRFPCSICNKDFSAKHTLIVHERTVHQGAKDLACHLCDFRTGHQSSLRSHLLAHERGMKYRCDKCSYEANSKVKMADHQNFAHAERNEMKSNMIS